MGHPRQENEAMAIEYSPAGQGKQSVLPNIPRFTRYLPASQTEQLKLFGCEYKFGGQLLQDMADIPST